MLFSILTRKGKVPRHNFHPKAPVLAKRRQISAGSSFRARFPCPAQLSSPREPGIQPNWPSVCSGHPDGETGSLRLQLTQMATAVRLQRQRWGWGFTAASRAEPRLVEGALVRALEPYRM